METTTPSNKQITFGYVCGQVLASSISNIIGLTIGHPLDLVKVSYLWCSFFIDQDSNVKRAPINNGMSEENSDSRRGNE
jgi:hypothetical protein